MGVSGTNGNTFGETKTISQWKWCFGCNGKSPTGQKCIETLELETLSKFSNTGSRSWSKPKAAFHKRSDTMFGYTRYSQNTEHLKQPLHTNRSQINTPMFVMWLKPSRGKQSMTPTKYLLGAIYYAKEINLHMSFS